VGNWVTTSHRVCNLVLRDRRSGVRPAGSPKPDPSAGDFDLSFLDMNPPDHTRLRRLAQPAFSSKQTAGYRRRIEDRVGDLLDRAEAAGEFDLVSALASPLPIAVITDLLGIPRCRRGTLRAFRDRHRRRDRRHQVAVPCLPPPRGEQGVDGAVQRAVRATAPRAGR